MNERAVSLFERYDIDIEVTRKGRGAIIAQTGSKEEVALVEYNGYAEHLFMEYALLKWLRENANLILDEILCAKDGNLSCMDYEGKSYIVKRFVEGRECNVYDENDLKKAAKAVAMLHRQMRSVYLTDCEFQNRLVESMRPTIENEDNEEDSQKDDSQKVNSQKDDSQKDNLLEDNSKITQFSLEEYENLEKTDHLIAEFEKRTNELVRVRNYIRKRSKKNDFELYFLKVYDKYMKQANDATKIITPECEKRIRENQFANRMYVHGDCTQHNILITSSNVTLVNFEKAGPHLQVKDLYLFMRKILEKNNWSFVIGQKILDTYENELPLTGDEKNYLYARFVYPEKFWKVANGYLNRRKSISAKRQLEKLIALEEREKYRQLFLKKWVETY